MRNALRDQLRHGDVTFGADVGIGSPEVAEAMGSLGFDWLHFDMQHNSLDTETVQTMIQAASYPQITPIVRPISNDLALINRALDIGAHAVVIPLVNSKEDAEKVVRASMYPPKGIRSWGPRRVALRDANYTATANAEVMIIPQIETKLALQNLEDIVSTEGIEAIFVGPFDLSMSLGVFREFDNPKFVQALEKIVSTCKAHDVFPGLLAPATPVKTSIERGFKLIGLGGDLGILTESLRNILREARSTAAPGKTT